MNIVYVRKGHTRDSKDWKSRHANLRDIIELNFKQYSMMQTTQEKRSGKYYLVW